MTNNRGFTLLELLVVIAIMGLMGTASVGGYRQMQRGLEESKTVDNVSRFVQLASERAQIDHLPTAVYFWNEMLRAETDDEPEIIVGRAVAVRYRGRLSAVNGSLLIDEFGDLEQFDEDGKFAEADSDNDGETMRLYLMELDKINSGDALKYSNVRVVPQTRNGKATASQTEVYPTVEEFEGDLTRDSNDNTEFKGKIVHYGYYLKAGGTADSDWKIGSPYGLEFQSLELPHNYIFGSARPTSMIDSKKDAGLFIFDVDASGDVKGAIVKGARMEINHLRPGDGGELKLFSIGRSEDPEGQWR